MSAIILRNRSIDEIIKRLEILIKLNNNNKHEIKLTDLMTGEYYNNDPYRDNEGTFRTHKLKHKKMIKRKGYYLNPITYELEEC